MSDVITPASPEQLHDALGWALGSKTPLEIVGSGSKRGFGHQVAARHVLDLSKLSGILFYEPEELVISMRAATPLAEVAAVLAEKKQQFHFEPGNFAGLLGDGVEQGGPLSGTIGGLVACNLSGPRRIKVGAARDHVLGFEAVSGRAEHFKSGGRVMKNVTGFDLSKLMAGSFGTLGVMHTITLKVMPCDEKTRTLLVPCDDPVMAGTLMTRAMGSENEVSAACWLAAAQIAAAKVPMIGGDNGNGSGNNGTGMVALRVEGPGPSVEWRCQSLRRLFADTGDCIELHSHNSEKFWQVMADMRPFAGGEGVLWRVSVAPASGGNVARQLADATGGDVAIDWAGALIWLRLGGVVPGDAMAGKIRDIANTHGGQAVLVRAPADMRRDIAVFHPQDAALARINARIAENFDPQGILNPGRITPDGGMATRVRTVSDRGDQ